MLTGCHGAPGDPRPVSCWQAAVAALEHILKSAAKYDCDAGKLESELQQLGLPKEHSSSLCRCREAPLSMPVARGP